MTNGYALNNDKSFQIYFYVQNAKQKTTFWKIKTEKKKKKNLDRPEQTE